MIRQVILKLLQHQVLVGICFAIAATARADEAADKLDFFERKIRPVLVEHCYACHSEKAANKNKLKGGLRLDRRSGAMAGGDSGPVIVAGKPEESLLISALRYESLEMPPTGRLPTEIAKDFEHWVRQGAVWPEDKLEKAANTLDLTDYDYWRASHWAWRPLKNAPLPVDREDKSCAARCDNWSTGAIDRFIFARLKAAGLQPSPPADRAVLFRRLHYDLLGLPPRYEEVQAFVRDDRPDAYRRLVDRLLAAPAYGERWGRHWLDVARYADNGGFNSQTKELYTNFPYAYTYRDYVVRAFNEDLPYDRFIVEQLSADKLELGEDNRALAALGFLTLGDKSFGTSREDRIDDCIDTVTRGLLGVTLSCARCHDHKYDPLPTADYYSLFGVFRNSNIDVASRLHTPEKSERLPLLFESEKERAVHQEQLRRAEHELETASQRFYKEAQQHFRRRLGDYLLAAADRASEQQKAGLAGELVKRWKAFLKKADLSRLSFFEAFGALTTKDSPLVLTREQALELPIHSGPGELRRLRRRLHHVKFDWPRAVALTDRSPVRESFVYRAYA